MLILMCTVVATDFVIFYLLLGKPQPSSVIDYSLLEFDNEELRLDQEEEPVYEPIVSHHLLGPCLFGIGWALSGICPGTVLAGAFFAYSHAFLWVLGCLFGSWAPDLTSWLHNFKKSRRTPSQRLINP